MNTPPPNLYSLPPEVLLQIITYLDIPDLHTLTLTTAPLRRLACDPLLHLRRLHNVPPLLSWKLSHRPSRRDLAPPNASIWLSRTHVLSRSISRSLVRIRVSHALSMRPPAADLMRRGVLPRGYSVVSPGLMAASLDVQRRRVRDVVGRKLERRPSVGNLVQRHILPEECGRPGAVSPVLVEARKGVMRERLKDRLRRWVEGRAVVAQRERNSDEVVALAEGVSVRALVRRLQARRERVEMSERGSGSHCVAAEKKRAQRAWGAEAEKERLRARNQPTRAHVLGLKRFWEGVTRAAAV
jgi:hypothetical protein